MDKDATTAPDGTFTADKLTITTTFGIHQINRLSVVASSQCAMSIYAKADGVNTLTILDGVGSNGSVFNLSTVTVTNIGTGVGTIVSVGNGWYRCITIVTTTGFRLYCPNSSSSAGDGTSGIYIWGAQLEAGETATEYIPTTTSIRTKFAGITQDGSSASNIPRIDYPPLGGCPSILVEPARTNEATQSDGNLSTYPTTLNVTDASSSFNSFVNAIQFPSTGESRANKSIVTTAQTYTISVFIKMDDNSVPILGGNSVTGNLCLLIASNIASSNLKVESYGNNVYRLSATATSTGVGLANGVYRFAGQVLKSFKTTGIQLEVGSNATSYIPTTTVAVPRNADSIIKTGITNLIGQTEGTLFAEVIGTKEITANNKYICIIGGTKNIHIAFYSSLINVVSSPIDISVGFTPNVNYKIAVRYLNTGNFRVYVNGVKTHEVNTYVGGTFNNLGIGNTIAGSSQVNSSINSVQLYKTALTDDQCILLTGPSFSSYPEMASALIYTLQ